ncbi:carboxylesterase/lipase family protein [Nonomuraea sp. NPDC050153]|uniref:carboxylesterase/lipase family protein n=1 Tax=Nonomuraea sp. NPDC050153 TaxID=3364359 RepID=UPI0037BAADFE
MRLVRVAAVTLSLVMIATPAPAESAPSPQVRTDKGVVKGEVRKDHRAFRGIPYAEPPTGPLRWRPPQPAKPWKGVRDATKFGGQCAQLAEFYGGRTSYGEDCLYLNVTAPRRGHDRPVMVWLHGGGNASGNPAFYDLTKLATRGDVVVVSVNYRLGALGWLAHPALEAGERYQSGNYGLLDQQAALRWVRRNIAAFGGDPRNVTLFGESAGAADICAGLASPTAAGLFDKTIAQSFSCSSATRTEEQAEAEGVKFAEAVGCSAGPAACLRALPAKKLMEAFRGQNPYPVVGGDHVLPLQPRAAFESGRFNRVPVMHGNTLDEMRLYAGLTYPKPITQAQYEQIARATYGANAAQVLARYPAAGYPDLRIGLATMMTHGTGPLATCAHQDAFALLSRAGVPVYAYQFADRTAPPLMDVPGFEEGAEHTTELIYLFPGLLGRLNAEQQRLSDAMVGYWTSFARDGRPQSARAPGWPQFRGPGDVLSLAPGRGGIHPADTAAESNCAFWSSLRP